MSSPSPLCLYSGKRNANDKGFPIVILSSCDTRLDTILQTDARFVLPSDDPRVAPVKTVCDRLVSVLDERSAPLSASPRYRSLSSSSHRSSSPSHDLFPFHSLSFASSSDAADHVQPSATTPGVSLPFCPVTNNPEKKFEGHEWKLYVVDTPKVNALVLPTKVIVVYTGLLRILGSDDELLSAVLAHEVSHVTERHAVENLGFLGASCL